jgi:RNA polymerase sigma-70 factor (ECF subfamily)
MSPDAVAGPVGQDARFAEYVVPELEVLYRVAQSITRNPTDAQDLVQDTLLRAYRAIERFDGRYPRAWLLTIMRNAQVNRVRRKRPELMHDPDETMSRVADESPDGADAESQLMDQEFEAPIEAALAALPEKFLRVVELVDLNQLSYQEAADVLGIPVGTVMSRLHRARRNIRQHLEASETEET